MHQRHFYEPETQMTVTASGCKFGFAFCSFAWIFFTAILTLLLDCHFCTLSSGAPPWHATRGTAGRYGILHTCLGAGSGLLRGAGGPPSALPVAHSSARFGCRPAGARAAPGAPGGRAAAAHRARPALPAPPPPAPARVRPGRR